MKTLRIVQSLSVGLVLLAAVVGQTASSSASTAQSSTGFSIRAVLCYAPALSKKTEFPAASALPSCRKAYQLTAKNIGVDPSNSSVSGFTSQNVKPDPRFLRFRNTGGANDTPMSNVLLPGIKKTGKGERYVLGPSQLSSSSFASAKAEKVSGQWVVTYRLTSAGSAAWNGLAKRQFHAFIAVVLNGAVYSAPLMQPSLNHFATFAGPGEIAGGFTKAQANYLAAHM